MAVINYIMFSGLSIYTVQKSGTHFMSDIISLMIDSNTDIYDKKSMYTIVPHLIKFNINVSIFSTHPCYINAGLIANHNYGFIIMIRNPLDICISKYFYNELRKSNPRTIFSYVATNILTVSNNMFSLYLTYNKYINRSIIIRFEDLILDLDNTLIKVFNFMKKHKNIEMPNYELIKQKVSFSEVNKQEKKRGLYKVGRVQKTYFHRCGKIGQAKNHFTKQQIAYLLKLIPKKIYKIYPQNMYCL